MGPASLEIFITNKKLINMKKSLSTWILSLCLIVFMPFSVMACTSCTNKNNDGLMKEDNQSQSNETTGSYVKESDGIRFTLNGVQFKMISVEHGTFTMGSNNANVQFSESPAHQVTLTKDFLIGETELTEALWNAVMANGGGSATHPKTSVTWTEAHTFINKLNVMAHQQNLIGSDENFILPTEAQWEFAAKGGNKSKGYKYSGSNNINEVAVTRENSGSDAPIDVKTKAPNELGIYDMSGNAYEWVDDYGGNYSFDSQKDPQYTSGSLYVKRGGSNYHSFTSEPYLFTTTGRYFYSSTDWTIGFRLALVGVSLGTTSRIATATAENLSEKDMYNLSGQRVASEDMTAVYILGGKKVYKRRM
jgi:formylglycine-generating enzyme required for sulfatase activity